MDVNKGMVESWSRQINHNISANFSRHLSCGEYQPVQSSGMWHKSIVLALTWPSEVGLSDTIRGRLGMLYNEHRKSPKGECQEEDSGENMSWLHFPWIHPQHCLATPFCISLGVDCRSLWTALAVHRQIWGYCAYSNGPTKVWILAPLWQYYSIIQYHTWCQKNCEYSLCWMSRLS
jgi:hypothetical protein